MCFMVYIKLFIMIGTMWVNPESVRTNDFLLGIKLD